MAGAGGPRSNRNLVSIELALPNGTNHTGGRATLRDQHSAMTTRPTDWTTEARELQRPQRLRRPIPRAPQQPPLLPCSAQQPTHTHNARTPPKRRPSRPKRPVYPIDPHWCHRRLHSPHSHRARPPPPPHRRRPTAQGSCRDLGEQPATECAAAPPLPRQCRLACCPGQLTSDARCAPAAAAA